MNRVPGLRITIITVCKNSGLFLSETINSVLNQTYRDIQYIIVDGNSTDDTLNIIKQYSAGIAAWISEDDEGMYDAINKGLKLATGDYILILNSDDVLFANNTIEDVVSEMAKGRLDYYYGSMIKLMDGKSKRVKLFNVNFKQLLLSTHGTFAPHPCFFISTELNKKLGGYSLTYKYASDYDYILRALSSHGVRGGHVDLFITKFRIHNNSITASGKIDEERKDILLQHGYYKEPYLIRLCAYYSLWIYYKIINLKQSYKVG